MIYVQCIYVYNVCITTIYNTLFRISNFVIKLKSINQLLSLFGLVWFDLNLVWFGIRNGITVLPALHVTEAAASSSSSIGIQSAIHITLM